MEKIEDIPNELHNPYRIILLFLFSNLWTLILVTLPVVVNLPPNNYDKSHPGWYTGSDVMRFIEPVGGTIINLFIFLESGIFRRHDVYNIETTSCILLFALGLGVYGQGSGFHSASNMFQNAEGNVLQLHDDDIIEDLYYWTKSEWEHLYSHYLYATGYALLTFSLAYAYKDHIYDSTSDTKFRLLLLTTSFTYSLLIAATAAEFPSGTIVGLLYVILYGWGVVGTYLIYLWKNHKVNADEISDNVENSIYQSPADGEFVQMTPDKSINTLEYEAATDSASNISLRECLKLLKSLQLKMRTTLILYYYFVGYNMALIWIIIWVIIVGGFRSRSQSGLLR